MSKLSGAFNQFRNLDKISPNALNRWLKIKKDPQNLLNFLGNRIIYPQTAPVTPDDMEIDLAILREALRLDSQKFYNKEKKEIEVPEEFLKRFVPEFKLLAAIIDGVEPSGLVEIVLNKDKDKKVIASFFNPEIKDAKGLIKAVVEGRSFKLLPNTLTLIPCKGGKLSLKIGDREEIKFNPGDIGIFVDLRVKL